ncbi:MAG: hypothetical protein E4G74_03290 [Erysipelotrichales bacterium]|nr:MAG: hypothetical protein E4G74_03290 [Erysipelotrichales bacterium]
MAYGEGSGILSTFEASGKDTTAPNVSDQSRADTNTVRMIEKVFARDKQHRAKYDSNWIDYYRFYRGDQWQNSRPDYLNDGVLNFVQSVIQTIIPIMTDHRPNVIANPENPSDFEFSEIMTQVLRSRWDRDNFSQILVEAIVDMAITGTCITEQAWNQDLNHGIGDFEFNTIEPLYCYPDARSRNVNDKYGKRFTTAIPTDVAEVKLKYPKKAHLIKSDLSSEDDIKSIKAAEQGNLVRSPTNEELIFQSGKPGSTDSTSQVLVITCWLDDETMIEEKVMEKDQEGKDIQKGFQQKKKYPNGRKIVIANKVLLEDIENPYIDGKKPFARGVNYILPREFWGTGEVEQLMGPQETINKIWAYMMDVMETMSNPVWLNPTTSGVFDSSLKAKPGLVIPHHLGSEPRRMQGSEIPSSMFAAFDRAREIFDKISGVNDVSQGVIPAGMSGVAIDELKEASQTRIRLKSRNVDAWLNDVGQMFASRILQFYTVPRIVRLTENDGAEKYFKFAMDETTNEAGEAQRTATVQHFEDVPDENGNIIKQPGEPIQYEIKGNLDIRISVGTTLPFKKAQKKAEAKELFQMGIYDADDLLEDLEHPRKTAVLQKYSERQAAASEAAAAEAQQEQAIKMAELQIKAGGGIPAPQGAQQPAPSPNGALAAVQ